MAEHTPSSVEPGCRYAVYFAHRVGSPWAQAGNAWLGRDAYSGAALPQPAVEGVSADLQRALTESPRRYGWHATLRAPFRLARGSDVDALRAAVGNLAQRHRAFPMPPLKVVQLDDFLALVPERHAFDIDDVAAACVRDLAAFAAPLDTAELARRRRSGLSATEDALLVRWGYPFVMEAFRFHLSLTGTLRGVDPAVVGAMQHAASAWFAALPPAAFDSVALFVEPGPSQAFSLAEEFPLGA